MNRPDTPPESRVSADDELRLSDLWRMLVEGRRWVMGLPLVFALTALAFVLLARPQWESTSVIQVGQVGQSDVGQVTSLIEPPARAVERLKLRSFRDGVLANMKIRTSDDEPQARVYRNSMQVRPLTNTDLIEIKVRGYSPEEARKFAEATISRLQEIHARLALPSIERLRSQLDTVMLELKRAQTERENLLSNVQFRQEIGPGNRFSESVLLGNMLAVRDAEIRDLQQRRLALEERLSPPRTYPTSLVEEIYVPEHPASPRRALTVSLAIVGGLIAGILLALTSGGLRRSAAPARQA